MGNNIGYFFIAPSLVDVFQVVAYDKPHLDYVILGMAVAGAIIGSGVRIGFEYNIQPVKRSRVLFILICSLCISYMAYEFSIAFNYTKIIGILSIIGGIISIDLIKMFIEDLPKMLKDAARKKLLNDTKEDTNNDIPDNRD